MGLDVCVLGREANVRYATGARRLWTSLSRPFGPTCIAVRGTRDVHLLSFSASYEGIPEELQPDDIYAVTWNPMNLVDHIRGMPETANAGRVGVDGLSPLFDGLLRMAFPAAELVGIQPELLGLRRVKLAAEIECLRIAAATAEASIVAAVQRLQPGTTGKQLQASYLARMCELGTSQFAQQGTFNAFGPGRRTVVHHARCAAAGRCCGGARRGRAVGGLRGLARTYLVVCRGERRRRPCARWPMSGSRRTQPCSPPAGTGCRAPICCGCWTRLGPIACTARCTPSDSGTRGHLPLGGWNALHWNVRLLQANMVVGIRILLRRNGFGYFAEDMALVGPARCGAHHHARLRTAGRLKETHERRVQPVRPGHRRQRCGDPQGAAADLPGGGGDAWRLLRVAPRRHPGGQYRYGDVPAGAVQPDGGRHPNPGSAAAR